MPKGPGDTDRHRRYAIVAGGGRIPVDLAKHLDASGNKPFVFMLGGDADPALAAYDHAIIDMERFGSAVTMLRGEAVTHVIMVGTVNSRPNLWRLRPSLPTLKLVPRVLRSLIGGDDALLKEVVGLFEENGFTVVGVHEVMPDLVADEGLMTKTPVPRGLDRSVKAGVQAARSLGALDAGQGVVVLGKRVVALEGAEGTDAMVLRVAELKKAGRLHDRKGGVLVKLSKPDQELRVDMPTIGVQTVHNAAEAKLEGIVVGSGSTLIVDRQKVIEQADERKLFVTGIGVPDRQADNDS